MILWLKNVCPGGNERKRCGIQMEFAAQKKANEFATGSGNNGNAAQQYQTNTNDPDQNWKSLNSLLSEKALYNYIISAIVEIGSSICFQRFCPESNICITFHECSTE